MLGVSLLSYGLAVWQAIGARLTSFGEPLNALVSSAATWTFAAVIAAIGTAALLDRRRDPGE